MNFSFLPKYLPYFNYGAVVTILISICVIFFLSVLSFWELFWVLSWLLGNVQSLNRLFGWPTCTFGFSVGHR